MNIKHLFFSLFAVAALAGCSSDDTIVNKDDAMISDGTPRYMRVNVVSNSTSGTRAEKFENGASDPDENAIKKIRFYFFDSEGDIAAVKADGKNYFDCVPSDKTEQTNGSNVEEILDAIIVINTKKGDRIPSQMLAVINPTEAGLPEENLSKSEVRNEVKDYAALANAKEPTFVMASSVYRDESMERISTSSITSANICTTEEAAKDKPVDVYVERNVAKVALQYGSNVKLTTDQKLVQLKDAEGNAISVSNANGATTQVYLKVLGWDLTAETEQAYLSKHINTEWGDALLAADEPWTSTTNHRSYWASNVLSGTGGMTGNDIAGIKYSSFNEHIAAQKTIAANDATLALANWKYTNENAGSDYNSGRQRTYPTQAIVLGQLVDSEGNPLTISEYLGAKYVEADENCENLKKTVAGILASVYYSKTTNDGNTVYNSISPEDLDIESVSVDAEDGDLQAQVATGRYKVKVKLSSSAEAKTWCIGNGYNAETISVNDLNTALAKYTAKVWKTGYTYYAFKIAHIAKEDVGQYGVVRNHYYKATIDAVYGLGTPVYNRDKKIYPEEPEEEESYIAAKINILAWRIVNSNVTLGE